MLFTSLFTSAIAFRVVSAAPAETRQDGGQGGLSVLFTNHPFEVTETNRLDADGVPRAVDLDFTVSVVSTFCAEVCIPELAYYCELFDRALQPVGNLTGPGSLSFLEGRQPFVSQITCYKDDFGAGSEEVIASKNKPRHETQNRQADNEVEGTVVFSNEEGDRYEHELVLDELVTLPETLLPVVYTDATVILSQDLRNRFWSCKAFARGRATFDGLGVFYASAKFVKTFVEGEVHAWKCD